MSSFVIPTYNGHFHEVSSLIAQIRTTESSFNEIILVLSKDDNDLFQELAVKNACKIVFIENLLEKYTGKYVEAKEIIKHIGKFRYQALKKLFGIVEAQSDDVFVLDSECSICNDPCQLFTPSYIESCVIYSERNWDMQVDSLSNAVRKECNFLLSSSNIKWFFESYNWLYSKQLVCSLLEMLSDKHGPEWVFRPEPLFECQLYYQFCYEGQYGYKFESVQNVLSYVLPDDEVNELLVRFEASIYRAAGVFEYLGHFVERDKYVDIVTNLDVIKCIRLLRHEPSLIYNIVDVVRHRSESKWFIGEASMHRGQFVRGKIAIIVSGNFNSEKDVDNLRSFLSRVESDVFISTDVSSPYISQVRDLIKPVKVITVNDCSLVNKFSALLLENKNVERNTKVNRDLGVASMFEKISAAIKEIEAHEISNDFKYSVVVRVRPDVFSVNTLSDVFMQVAERYGSLNGAVFFPNRFWSQGVNDQFFFAARDEMLRLLESCTPIKYLMSEYLNPEWFLAQECLKHNLSIVPFEFQYILTRGCYPDVDTVTHSFNSQERLFWSKTCPVPAIKDARAYIEYTTKNIKFKNDMKPLNRNRSPVPH